MKKFNVITAIHNRIYGKGVCPGVRQVPFIFMVFLFSGFLFLTACSSGTSIQELKLLRALPVEYTEPVEPSGLTGFADKLYTVSDDHDSLIFQVEIRRDRALLIPHRSFTAPGIDENSWLDFEGITCDKNGNFYIVSESRCQVLRVSAKGDSISWVGESLYPAGREKGLFQVKNAFLEGITCIEPGQFLMVAERQPRGIIELGLKSDSAMVTVIPFNYTRLNNPRNLNIDFSGLCSKGDTVFVLERWANCITQIELRGNAILEKRFWSYEKYENSDEFRYSSTRYGHGEGLWMDNQFVYVILDNNGDFRVADSTDTRPQLFIFERPQDMQLKR